MKIFLLALLIISHVYANFDNLANNKKWLKLLHYENGKSTIINKDFFLAKEGMTNSKNELLSTITKFKKNDLKVICKYPARYTWLSKKLSWNKNGTILAHCKEYNNWKIMKNNDTISTIFVSGFLGNPASAFGHSFFKLNQENQENNLLNNTISYGAKLPKKYSMLSYMYDGVFGGYTAAYSNKKYYMDDMAYTNKDFRDMWEYTLRLSKKEKDFFFMHLWELKNVEFKYYFLNRNCGYKVADFLDLILDENILDDAKVWYAPIETFYRLMKYKYRISSVKYLPSMQQNIYAQYRGLQNNEKDIIFNMINREKYVLKKSLALGSKIRILDFVLNFYTYKMGNMEIDSSEYKKIKMIKEEYVFERMSLPISDYKIKPPKNKRDITENNEPIIFDVALVNKQSITMGVTLFGIDKLGYNEYLGDKLSMLNIVLKLEKNKIDLYKVNLIDIRRLKTQELPFDVDIPISWNLEIGFKNTKHIDYFASGGLGYTWKINHNVKLYTILEASIHSQFQRYRLTPMFGAYIDLDKFKVNAELGKENIYTKKIKESIYDIALQYNFNKDKALYVNYNKSEKSVYEIGFKWYF